MPRSVAIFPRGSFNASLYGFPISPPRSPPFSPAPYILLPEWRAGISHWLWLFRAESRKIHEGKPVTIDFTCFLSEIALFFFFPLSHSFSLPFFASRTLAFRVTAKIDTIPRTSHDHLGGLSRAVHSASGTDLILATWTARPANLFNVRSLS